MLSRRLGFGSAGSIDTKVQVKQFVRFVSFDTYIEDCRGWPKGLEGSVRAGLWQCARHGRGSVRCAPEIRARPQIGRLGLAFGNRGAVERWRCSGTRHTLQVWLSASNYQNTGLTRLKHILKCTVFNFIFKELHFLWIFKNYVNNVVPRDFIINYCKLQKPSKLKRFRKF